MPRASSVRIKSLLKLFVTTCGGCALMSSRHTCMMPLSHRFGECLAWGFVEICWFIERRTEKNSFPLVLDIRKLMINSNSEWTMNEKEKEVWIPLDDSVLVKFLTWYESGGLIVAKMRNNFQKLVRSENSISWILDFFRQLRWYKWKENNFILRKFAQTYLVV